MKITKSIAAGLAVVMLTALSVIANAPPIGTGWSKDWNSSDGFNYWGDPNSSKWVESNEEDWNYGGHRSQYLKSNVRCNGSALVIESHWQARPGQGPNTHYSGGRVDSAKKFTYGWFECSSRLDWSDNHFWATFWMWEWRADKSATEFDIMEFNHNHYNPSQSHHYKYKVNRTVRHTSTPVNSYHRWGVLWLKDHVSLWIDGSNRMDSNNSSNASGEVIPMLFTSSPNYKKKPSRSGNYPKFFVDWVDVYKGGTLGGGGGGGGGSGNPPMNSTIYIKSLGSGKYVTQKPSQGRYLFADHGDANSNHERFVVVNAGGGWIALKNISTQKYVQANGGNGWKMHANKGNIGGAWEKFKFTQGGLYCANGKWVKANGSGTSWQMQATNGSVAGSWEKFSWAHP